MIDCLLDKSGKTKKFVTDALKAAHFGESIDLAITEDGNLIGGILYSDFNGSNIEMTIYCNNPKWATKKILKQVFYLPFDFWNVKHITAVISKKNKKARKFVERVGFIYEGNCRQSMPDGTDAIIYGMLKEERKF